MTHRKSQNKASRSVISFCEFKIKQSLGMPLKDLQSQVVRMALYEETEREELAMALLVLTPSSMQREIMNLFAETARKQ